VLVYLFLVIDTNIDIVDVAAVVVVAVLIVVIEVVRLFAALLL